tara:strand:+ start:1556 stop:2341 length:786 start_codon:yes stop_codon:yes gene_type:complete
MSKETSLVALDNCFTDFSDLIQGFSEDDWGTQSLCPNWDVRGVVTHLAGIEDLLLAWVPQSADEWPPFGKMAEFESAVADLSSDELLEKVLKILNERRQELAEIGDDVWEAECMTPIGPATYGRFMNVRVFDFWVHQRDMTIPLGINGDDSGAHAEIALDEVHGSLGYIAGKKIGLEDGMSIAFHLHGAIKRNMFAAVEGRAKVVDNVDAPTVSISADMRSFMMLACGRIDPQQEIDAGRISWTGDAAWGERAARNLRFTI